MNDLLTLHFFKGMTNVQKRLLAQESIRSNTPVKAIIFNALKDAKDLEKQWSNACELAAQEAAICQQEGVSILTVDDVDNFPSFLLEIPDPPVALFGRGTWSNQKVPLAVIGARKSTHYGNHQCKRFVEDLSQFPINIISGLALGIDGTAHRTALDCGASTQAFLAGGLAHLSPPRHARLAQQILDGGGGYFTEQPFHTASLPQYYPVRNRLIAGSSLATLVVEAARKSGAMITANQAFQYGREVYALPGAVYQPMSAGPNRLIAEDIARLVVDAEHLVSSFYPIWAKKESQIDLSQALEGLLIQHFPHGRKVHSAYLKSKLNVSNSQLFKSLQVLLDLGVIAKIGPHTYVRKTAGH